jgi:hypothetical protein
MNSRRALVLFLLLYGLQGVIAGGYFDQRHAVVPRLIDFALLAGTVVVTYLWYWFDAQRT